MYIAPLDRTLRSARCRWRHRCFLAIITHTSRVGLTRPANLQLVQGGFPEREMWPKGNIERQPSSV